MAELHHVTDFRSNEGEHLVFAAQKVGRSPFKKKIFKAVYFGKKKAKSVSEIVSKTGIKRKRVLEEAKKLVNWKLFHQKKVDGEIVYEKDDAYQAIWQRVLKKAGDKKAIDKIPTKSNPRTTSAKTVNIRIPTNQVKIEQITIDNISSFREAKSKKIVQNCAVIPETKFKKGILKILGETGTPPKDWGGEKNDIYTTRLKIGGTRMHAALALKGPGQRTKKLTPRHMGKNGDQIQRLTASSAQVFIVQYWGQIDQSVVDLMQAMATAKSYAEGRKIYFGVIDGIDSSKLIKAYPKAFK